MNKQSTRRLLLYVCCFLLALTPLSAMAATETDEEPIEVINTLKEFTKLDLTPYEGKAIFINFFTQWCVYCMEEMPDIKAAYDEYNSDDLQIILVHVWDGEDERNTAEIRKTYGMEDMVFFEDEDKSLAEFVGLEGYPASLFIAKDGTLAAADNSMLSKEMIDSRLSDIGATKKTVTP